MQANISVLGCSVYPSVASPRAKATLMYASAVGLSVQILNIKQERVKIWVKLAWNTCPSPTINLHFPPSVTPKISSVFFFYQEQQFLTEVVVTDGRY